MVKKKAKKKVTHKTGYVVWLYGESFWHRTFDGAMARVNAKENFYARKDAQVIDVSTGKLVYGRRQ